MTSKINVKSVPLLRRSYYKAEPPFRFSFVFEGKKVKVTMAHDSVVAITVSD